MNFNYYKSFKIEDFVSDENFRNIIRQPDADKQIALLIKDIPEKEYEINLAAEMLKALHTNKFTQTKERKKELWQQIVKKKKSSYLLTVVKYAAVFFLLFGTSLYFFNVLNNKNEEPVLSELTNPTNEVILMLANGKNISISTQQSTVKYSADGSAVMVNDSSGAAQPVEGVNKMIVPYGKRSVLTLSDGTKVWLNSGSTLTFPPVFGAKTREVILEGEAYFDVSHNKEKPFYVQTDGFKMRVYGTKFNIQAYKNDNSHNVVLVEGKVSMKSNLSSENKEIFLAPNEKATIVQGESNIQLSKIEDTNMYTSWIDGYLIFNNEDILHLLKRVSRYYNVDINLEVDTDVEYVYGKLDLKDNIEKVLDGISFISKTKYRKVGLKYEFYDD